MEGTFGMEDWVFLGEPHPEDGHRPELLSHFITFTTPRGEVFAYRHWSRTQASRYERPVIQEEGQALIARFEARLEAGEVPSLDDHWSFHRCIYGSEAFAG